MRSCFKLVLACIAPLFWSGSAEAGRTVIDQIDGVTYPKTLSGYCDLDRIASDCTPTPLGYEVDFGTGFKDGVIVYGNGLISFGTVSLGSQPAFGPDVNKVEDLGSSDSVFFSLSDYNDVVVSGGLNNDAGFDRDFNSRMIYIGSLSLLKGGVIDAKFYDCFSTTFCGSLNTTLTLTPMEGGYRAEYDRGSSGVVGYALPGATPVDSVFGFDRGSFFIPAQFRGLSLASGVPEPSTWAMMLFGFGAIGGAMRRRREKATISYT